VHTDGWWSEWVVVGKDQSTCLESVQNGVSDRSCAVRATYPSIDRHRRVCLAVLLLCSATQVCSFLTDVRLCMAVGSC